MEILVTTPPNILFEDDTLLVINKPPGINTHSPAAYAGEGIYDWLRHRDPRWSKLAIIHRLDKETSGVLLFSKTAAGNVSLTDQFTRRLVRKRYFFLTDGKSPRKQIIIKSTIVRRGDRYESQPSSSESNLAITKFRPVDKHSIAKNNPSIHGVLSRNVQLVEAEPLTGRTHQIRVHASENGFPVLGDTHYGGTPASRLCLHAAELECQHPVSKDTLRFYAPVDFCKGTAESLRTALISPALTDSHRLIHGAADGWPRFYVDKFGGYLLAQSEIALSQSDCNHLQSLMKTSGTSGVYHKTLSRQTRSLGASDASPGRCIGDELTDELVIHENGLRFHIRFDAGYSAGLFLDQRDNRLRALTGHIAAGFDFPQKPLEVLNTFSYTCGFSVASAKRGDRTTSLDLSRKYLDWGKSNFQLNGIDPTQHDFIFGDAFDWFRRLQKKKRDFDIVLLDPPTFSQSKSTGIFRAEKDYHRLVVAALAILKPGGIVFASTNAADWPPEKFVETILGAVKTARRKTLQQHYVPQPPDFPVTRDEPAYLKTLWLLIE